MSGTHYCNTCKIGFLSIPGYLVHCSSAEHRQKEEDEFLSMIKAGRHFSRRVRREASVSSDEKLSATEPRSPSDNRDRSTSPEPKKSSKKSKKAKNSFLTAHDIAVSYCPLCDINCTGKECFTLHCAGKQHCKKYLVKQNEVGFVKFRQQYGNLDYNKDDKDEPPPEVKDDYVIHAYRSGVYNKLNCRACCCKLYTYRAWYDHILSREHGEQMLELLERHGNQTLMSMFGDLPGPNPNLFDTREDDERKRTKPNPPARAYERELSSSSERRSLVGDPAVRGGPPKPLPADMVRQSMLEFAGLNTAQYRGPSLTPVADVRQYHERDRGFDGVYSYQRPDDVQVARKRPYESQTPVGWPPYPAGGDGGPPRAVLGDRDDRYGTEIDRMPESYVTSRHTTRPMNFEVFDHRESFEEFAGAGRPGVRPPMFPGRVEDRSGSVPQYMDPSYPVRGEDRSRSVQQHVNPMFPGRGQERPQSTQQHMDPTFPGRSEYRPQSTSQQLHPLFSNLIRSVGLTDYFQSQRPPMLPASVSPSLSVRPPPSRPAGAIPSGNPAWNARPPPY